MNPQSSQAEGAAVAVAAAARATRSTASAAVAVAAATPAATTPAAATPAAATPAAATPATTPTPTPTTATVSASAATVRGARGAVFGPLTAASDAPITLVHGSRGSGRTSFLLACGGRMKLSAGELTVLGMSATKAQRQLRNATGLAGFDAIDALEPAARVDEAVRERLTWIAPWYRRVPKLTQATLAALLSTAWGPLGQPSGKTLVRDLSERDDLLLRIALALTERPKAVLVDDLDGVKDPIERAQVAARIEALAAQGIHFIVGSTDHRDLELFTPSTAGVITLGAE